MSTCSFLSKNRLVGLCVSVLLTIFAISISHRSKNYLSPDPSNASYRRLISTEKKSLREGNHHDSPCIYATSVIYLPPLGGWRGGRDGQQTVSPSGQTVEFRPPAPWSRRSNTHHLLRYLDGRFGWVAFWWVFGGFWGHFLIEYVG